MTGIVGVDGERISSEPEDLLPGMLRRIAGEVPEPALAQQPALVIAVAVMPNEEVQLYAIGPALSQANMVEALMGAARMAFHNLIDAAPADNESKH
jgi:hypothetical protein